MKFLYIGILFLLWGCVTSPHGNSPAENQPIFVDEMWNVESVEKENDLENQPNSNNTLDSIPPSQEIEQEIGKVGANQQEIVQFNLDGTQSKNSAPQSDQVFFSLRPQPNNPAAGCFENGCHADFIVQAGDKMHKPFSEGLCEPCHLVSENHPEGSGKHVASMKDIEICEPCHPTNGLGTSHPVDEGQIDANTGGLLTCTSTCHDPHFASYPGLLRYPGGGTLCLMCHEEDL